VVAAGESWGTRLKALRQKRGWTQLQLARKAGVARNTVARLEIGNRRASGALLDRLAMALEVPVTELLPAESIGRRLHELASGAVLTRGDLESLEESLSTIIAVLARLPLTARGKHLRKRLAAVVTALGDERFT